MSQPDTGSDTLPHECETCGRRFATELAKHGHQVEHPDSDDGGADSE